MDLVISRTSKKYWWKLIDHWGHSFVKGEGESIPSLLVQFEFVEIVLSDQCMNDLHQLPIGYEYLMSKTH